ncbi:hypothetical protein [Pseudonocardia alni]|uniref:hypothetical protein n=1 Tax=Pseudonocardia alni TaxID=33907 RepID=UPI00332D7A58
MNVADAATDRRDHRGVDGSMSRAAARCRELNRALPGSGLEWRVPGVDEVLAAAGPESTP